MFKKLFGFLIAFSLASSSTHAVPWTRIGGLTSTGLGIVLVGKALHNVYRTSMQKSLPSTSRSARVRNFLKSFSKANIAQTVGGVSLIIAGLYGIRYKASQYILNSQTAKTTANADVTQQPVSLPSAANPGNADIKEKADMSQTVQSVPSEETQEEITQHPVNQPSAELPANTEPSGTLPESSNPHTTAQLSEQEHTTIPKTGSHSLITPSASVGHLSFLERFKNSARRKAETFKKKVTRKSQEDRR